MPDPAAGQLQHLLRDRFRNGAAADARLGELQGYEDALRQDPQKIDTYLSLAACHRALGQTEKAIAALREALEQCAPDARLYRAYISVLKHSNRTEEAYRAADRGLAVLHGADAAVVRITKLLVLPILYRTPEEVDDYRRRYQAELDALCRETRLDTAAERAAALAAVRSSANFYLAYQSRNDRDLQSRYGELLGRVMTANYPQWSGPREMPPWQPGEPLRVGYVSARFCAHSVMKSHSGWIEAHGRSKIAIHTYYVGRKADSTTEEVERKSARFRHLPGDLEGACEAIAGDRLHVLVFLDIGMDPLMGLLGALRLAPVQCATWGHPVTTGLPSMDYYLSSELMETEESDGHYSERLVRLPGIGIWYRKPVIPRPLLWKTRRDFGLREDAVVYLSCQSQFKYLPQYDRVFAEIAARVPAAQFVFLSFNQVLADEFRKRLDGAFSKVGLNAGERCVILPAMNQTDYWNLNLRSDVYLDSIGWSGCNSTMEAIACDLPVVTLPGECMRGRHSYAMLTQLGVTETIAGDEAGYVDLAVRLGLDGEWRKSVVARMRERMPKLYQDRSCVEALERFYERVVREFRHA